MNTRTNLTLILLSLAVIILFLTPACTPVQDAGASAPVNHKEGEFQTDPGNDPASEPLGAAQDIPESNHSAPPDGMVAFEGTIFVALTAPVTSRWQSAGWRMGTEPVDTDAQQAPLDCSLYPHRGVQDQWVGGCRGHVLIPQDGAQHIAVMVTSPDGSSTMVQIAPPPEGEVP